MKGIGRHEDFHSLLLIPNNQELDLNLSPPPPKEERGREKDWLEKLGVGNNRG